MTAPSTSPSLPASGTRFDAFVRRHTILTETLLVPEVRLWLAGHAHDIFQIGAEFSGGWALPPYWAFAWPGGQGLARYLLDWPELVRGKRILDLGAGSGIQSIAAMKAGARSALCADIDPLAEAAARRNALLNGVRLETTMVDLLGTSPDADLIIIGDLVYEPELETRVGAFLQAAARSRTPVLFGDRTTSRRPPLAFELLAEYVAPVTPALLDGHMERARVWRLG